MSKNSFVLRLTNSIKRIMAISRKELFSWFISPAFYGITLFFLLFVSIWFYYLNRFFAMDTVTLRPFFSSFPLAFILVIPVITMRAWAEENKLGSSEILFTLPFTDWELVLGKFFSSLMLLLIMLILTLPVPLTLIPLGYFDPGVIFAEYSGAVLLGACAVSLGLFLSGISKSQSAAFIGSVAVLLVIILVNNFTAGLPPGLASLVNYISLTFHFESFSRGLLDSRDISFFILTTAFFLFLNVQILVFRRWN